MSGTTDTRSLATLVARLCAAAVFIPSGWAKIASFSGTVGYIASKGLPLPEVAALLAIAAELGLGLLLLAGFRTRWAALGLAIFVAVLTPVFHRFWGMPPDQAMLQQQMFFKNLGIFGGLLMLAGFGGGRWSADAALSVPREPARRFAADRS